MISPRLYIFVGYPGAGKTTIAKYINQKTGAHHLWADKERQRMFSIVTHSIEESKTLYAKLNQQTKQQLTQGTSVIFDTNFNYFSDRQLMRQLAAAHNAKLVIMWLTTPIAIAKSRALHQTHRDRNGYLVTMSEAEFIALTSRLETPSVDEQATKIDGAKIDYSLLDQILAI